MNIQQKTDGFKNQKIIVLPDNVVFKCSKSSLIRTAYITDIGFFPYAKYHYRERLNTLGSYIIIYCADGEGFYSIDHSDREILRKGNLLIIPKNTAHYYGTNDTNPWSIYWFHVRGETVERFFNNISTGVAIPLNFDMSSKFIALFFEIYTALEKGYIRNNLIYAAKVFDHILGIIYYSAHYSEAHTAAMTNGVVGNAIQYMNEHLFEKITLNDLCERVKLSAPYFLKIFKKHTGYSPIDYFLRLKIQHSCQYLDLTSYSIKKIAEKFGFSDPYYYSRLFKKIMNKSPSEYRKTIKG